MTIQYHAANIANEFLGEQPGSIKFFSGTLPSDCSGSDPSGLIATADFWNNCSSGGTSTSATFYPNYMPNAIVTTTGTISCFRMYNRDTTFLQGTVSLASGDGDLLLDIVDVASGQTITFTAFVININT